jgi:hypothetical protein
MIGVVVLRASCGHSVPVDPSRDWLDYLSAWSGLIGAALAALAIIYAAWQSVQTREDLVRERRLEFELGLLAKIRRQMSVTQFQHLSGYVGALIADSKDETDVPVLRAVIGTKPGPEGRRRKDRIAEDARSRLVEAHVEWLKEAAAEVDAAIQRRLKE